MVVNPISAVGFGLQVGSAILGNKAQKKLINAQLGLQNKVTRDQSMQSKRIAQKEFDNLEGGIVSSVGATGGRMQSAGFNSILSEAGSDYNFKLRAIANSEQNAINQAVLNAKSSTLQADAQLFTNLGEAVMGGGGRDFKHYLGKGMETLGGFLTGSGSLTQKFYQVGPEAISNHTRIG